MFRNSSLLRAQMRRGLSFPSPAKTVVGCFLALVLVCLAVAPQAYAVTNPQNQTVTTLVVTDTTHHRISQSNFGTPIILSASVKTITGIGVLKGTIVFCDVAVAKCLDGHSLGSAQILLQPPPNNTASITIVPTFGAHSFRAVFLGTGPTSPTPSYGSTSAAAALFHVVTPPLPGTTTTTLTSSGTPGNYTLTARVTATGAGTIKPTGNVNFIDISNSSASLGIAPLGNTKYTFGFAGPWALPPMPPYLYVLSAVADVNNDGRPDLILVVPDPITPGQCDLEVMLNSLTGLTPPIVGATLPQNKTPLAIVTGDFNNDDKIDLAISFDDATLYTFFGSGVGQFGVGLPIPTFFIVTSMAVADFTQSGNQSIIAITPLGYQYFDGHGDLTFAPPNGNLDPNNDWDSAVSAGDVNGDGFTDFVVTDPVTNAITVYLGNGQGGFAKTLSFPVGDSPASMVMADFNGDGILDVATANSADTYASVLLGDGTGKFGAAVSTPITGNTPMSIALGDFNHDGIFDLAVENFDDQTVTILLGKGDGTFRKFTNLTADASGGLLAADFNSDGYTDLGAIGLATPDIFLANSSSISTAQVTGIAVAGTGTHQVQAGYHGDTVYTGSPSNTVSLTAEPLVTTLQLTAKPGTSSFGQQVAFTATLTPYSAQGYSTDGETVTFFNGTTNLGVAQLQTGAATINISSLAIGTHTLKAVYAGDTNFTAATSTLSFTVDKAPSTTTLAAATLHPTVGTSDLLTATVVGYTFPRGNVVFTQDGNTVCTIPLASTGTATCSWTPWSTNAANLTATYQGDAKHASSTSPTLTISATATYDPAVVMTFDTTTLTYPGATNARTCITRATSATPTGTVQILDGATNIQTLIVGGDGCAYWYINPGLNAGAHPIRAYYSGDSNNTAGYSAITNVTVNKVTTYMSHACWNSSFQYGQNYQCNVSAWSNANSPPGNILYTYDGGPAQTAALSSGNTSFVISLPAIGQHTVTIWYPGSANYSATSTQSETFTVN